MISIGVRVEECSSSPRCGGGGRSVVIVDDDDAIVETLREVLEAEGYQVEGYTDPIQALERIRASEPPDALVLDCVMPVMDGRRFMEALAEEGRTIPIVLVTALCDPGFCVDLSHPLAAALINKPFDLDRLVETLERVATGAQH
jgi:two-component system response regulator MprA